jgi:hypothetical protein
MQYFYSFSGYRPPREILFRYLSTEFKSAKILHPPYYIISVLIIWTKGFTNSGNIVSDLSPAGRKNFPERKLFGI